LVGRVSPSPLSDWHLFVIYSRDFEIKLKPKALNLGLDFQLNKKKGIVVFSALGGFRVLGLLLLHPRLHCRQNL
jgi:hypothetical protein